MTTTFELIKQLDARTVAVKIEGLEPIPVQRPYTMHPTGMLLPERVDIRWEDGELVRLSVSGPKLKKSGEVGLQDSTTWFIYYGKSQQPAGPPLWLASLVSGYAPEGQTL